MNDSPIDSPDDDRFGIDPFAQAIATSIKNIRSPIGATIAINGPWGSGKSSAINLIKHHLASSDNTNAPIIIDFKCWWFRGEEALTLAFLQELNSAMERTLGDKARDAISKLGKMLLRAGPVVGPVINAATGGAGGTVAEASIDFIKEIFSGDQSVENIFNDLSNTLAKQSKRFVIIIDDIDRLTPDEALVVFRLAKSVGRLPNVLYLLAFDRELAEKAVREIYPSEGPHFLEKIIQASFELPLPTRDELNSAILTEVEKWCGAPTGQEQLKRFMNVFYDLVSPITRYPRDITRISNAISISWPPVANEVDVADYLALEVMRLFETEAFNFIRNNKDRLCGLGNNYSGKNTRDEDLARIANLASERNREAVKSGLLRLFPRLENMGYGAEFIGIWEASRRVCTEKHFDTYFRMSLSNETLSIAEIETFIDNCASSSFVSEAFRKAAIDTRRNGKSKVPLLLDELNVHGAKIGNEKFEPLFVGIFSVADEIWLQQDHKGSSFSFGDTHLRIHWLIRRLTFDRCNLEERSKILAHACGKAQLGWLVDFVNSAIQDHHPRDKDKTAQPPEKCLLTEQASDALKISTIKSIEAAAKSGELITCRELAYILFRWREFANDDGESVKKWTTEQLSNDIGVSQFAKAFSSESWSQTVGDRVSIRHIKAGVDGLDKIMNKELFRKRLEKIKEHENLGSPHKEDLETFLEAWRKKDKGIEEDDD